MKKTDGYTSKDSIYSGCKLPRKIKDIRTVGEMRKALEEYHDKMRLSMRDGTMAVFVANVGRDDEHLVIEEDWDDI